MMVTISEQVALQTVHSVRRLLGGQIPTNKAATTLLPGLEPRKAALLQF